MPSQFFLIGKASGSPLHVRATAGHMGSISRLIAMLAVMHLMNVAFAMVDDTEVHDDSALLCAAAAEN